MMNETGSRVFPIPAGRRRGIEIVLLALIFAVGIFLRLPPQIFSEGETLSALKPLHPTPGFMQVGFDEHLYDQYLGALIKKGISSYPDIVDDYIATQAKLPAAILPPVRFLYIFSAYLWHLVFGGEPLTALYQVAALFSMLTLSLATIFAWRLGGGAAGLGVAGLMAVAPTQLHMSQHALIDGVFTFWALSCLWLLWENLRNPRNSLLLIGYALSLAALVLTKENSFFVGVALLVLLVTNRWLKFGTVTPALLLTTVAGPLLGIVTLVFLAGGLHNLISTYELLVAKASQTPYAIMTGDGPWYRYFVDLLLVSPVILILAGGSAFRLDLTKKPELYLLTFVAASYVAMCNVKYGMNLRYANMWDMPLRFLAFGQIATIASHAKRYRVPIIAAAVVLVAAVEFRQYLILAVQYRLYELVTHDLMQALHILKSP
jgi:4-amino-4-deoxy-L-arabinose transferase-like glycosyltransferase